MEPVLREHIQKYLPDMFGLFYEEPNWEELTNQVNNSPASNASSYLEANLYEIINGAEQGDYTALGLLEYFNIIFREICTISDRERKLLNNNAIKVLTEVTSRFIWVSLQY